jgi:outer membrane protein assembly factor BamE (lipoprotein component of BamABCDE complex)
MKKSFLSTFAVLALLSACTPVIDNRGMFVPPDKLSQIKPNESTTADVAKILGTPSATASYGDLTWYYIGQEMESLAFYKPKVTKQNVLAIHFNKDGTVASIDQKDLGQARDVKPVKEKTPTQEDSMTMLQQLMGNVGRFNGKEGVPKN